jgi:hypothetical protein
MRLPVLLTASAILLSACGSKEEPYVGWEIETLAPDRGFTVRFPEFEVPAGRENQRCWFMQVPDVANGAPVMVSRVLMAKTPGSHHLNVFKVRTLVNMKPEDGVPVKLGEFDGTMVDGSDQHTYRSPTEPAHPCWDSANWADWPLVANSQDSDAKNPYTDWTLPTDVAISFLPGEWIMLQSHYVNASEQLTEYGASMGINFYKYEGVAPMEMGSLFATQQEIRICKTRSQVMYSGTCKLPEGTNHISAANGHFHKRGKQFSMYTWDGVSDTHPPESDKFYESFAWNEPPMATGLDAIPPSGGGIWWDCHYQWREPDIGCDAVNEKDKLQEDDCCYTFGGNTDVGEHCNVFLYFYPKTGSDVFCN